MAVIEQIRARALKDRIVDPGVRQLKPGVDIRRFGLKLREIDRQVFISGSSSDGAASVSDSSGVSPESCSGCSGWSDGAGAEEISAVPVFMRSSSVLSTCTP